MDRCVVLLATLVLTAAAALGADPLEAFPAAKADQVRFVLRLPEKPDESDFRVELVVGKTVELDERNRYFFGGRLRSETVQGWGYSYYQLDELGPMAGTLMAVPPDAPKVPRFVSIGGEPGLIRYNSRLPLVVYVPAGVEVRYRVWSADGEAKPMRQE